MEWVEVTAKSVESAKELALDRLGISVDDAEFDVVEDAAPGLVRANPWRGPGARPGQAGDGAPEAGSARPAQQRRRAPIGGRRPPTPDDRRGDEVGDGACGDAPRPATPTGQRRKRSRASDRDRPATISPTVAMPSKEGRWTSTRGRTPNRSPSTTCASPPRSSPSGLVSAFGLQATTSSQVEGNEIEVRIDAVGDGLGLLIGPSGRTLLAIQDLARVAAQRRLGDHDTRLRVDVAGYREKRRAALERFAREVAELVKQSGRRPLAGADAVVGPQGPPRHPDDDRRRRQPVRGRGSLPPDHRQPG